MKYRAVIFDLFGTLVDDLGGPEYLDVFARMASVLSVKDDDLRRLWSDTYHARNTGGFSTIEDNIAYICVKLGIQPGGDAIKRAAEVREKYKRNVMMATREGTIEVLSTLKEWKCKTGLVSDCAPTGPML
jgi:putative hydrolase of the HAD superfamily